MAGKRIGNNITLGVDVAGGSSFASIGSLISIDGGELTKDDVEVSLLADDYKSYLPGTRESGEFKFVLLHDPNDSTNQILVDLYNRDATGTIPNWQVTYPTVAGSTTAVNETFKGYVKTLGQSYGKNELLARNVTVKLTGEHGATAST
jgi:hypothetical protein